MNMIHSFFAANGYVFELVFSTAFYIWGQKHRKNFVVRVFTVVIGMLMVSMLWQLLPIKNPLTESMRTAVFFVLCTLGVTFCFHVNFMESAFYNTAAAATQHLCFKAARSVVILFTRNGIEISVLNDIVYVIAIVVFEAMHKLVSKFV